MHPSRPAFGTALPAIVMAILVGIVAEVHAQPPLTTLWPNEDGTTWRFRFEETGAQLPPTSGLASLHLEGTIMTAGGEAQVLAGVQDVSPASLRASGGLTGVDGAVWHARPDLRAAIAARGAKAATPGAWTPLFLHDGYFMKSSEAIRMWQPSWNHATWTYLTSDLSVGATFTHQLVPELATDIFLHGTVAAIDEAVTTPIGTFEHALRVDYLIDLGILVETDESGGYIGTSHGEIRGHVCYVPSTGPVSMFEESVPVVWADCAPDECPQDLLDRVGVIERTTTLGLTALPLGPEDVSWGSVKALYR